MVKERKGHRLTVDVDDSLVEGEQKREELRCRRRVGWNKKRSTKGVTYREEEG